MLIKNYIENDDGSLDYEYQVSDEEADVLIKFAIDTLIDMGWIKIGDENIVVDPEGVFSDSYKGTLQ